MLIHYAAYAQQHGKTRGAILHHISAGHLHTAVRMDRHWMVDGEGPYPAVIRSKRNRSDYEKAYYQSHKPEYKQYREKYYKAHADQVKSGAKSYYAEHLDESRAKRKQYNRDHQDQYKKYQHEYYEKHKNKSPE